MTARVTGGTCSGGTSVEVLCPTVTREMTPEGWAFLRCEAELDCEQSAGGLWTLPHRCPGCGWLITGTGLGHRIITLGEEAINAYGGPDDDEMAAYNDMPSAAERHEIAGRQYRELKR